MTVSFADIEDKFDPVFGFIRRDLERILTLDPGGNFAVALLATCACETLARYRYGSTEGADVFVKLLPPGPYQKIAKTIYGVLRNGLVHRYDAADIKVDGKTVRITIAWKEHRHLSVEKMKSIPHLVLNMKQLCHDLFLAFDEYRGELEKDGTARDHFFTTYRHGKVTEVKSVNEANAWQEILEDH